MHKISKQILDLIENTPGVTRAKIADHLKVSRATVTKWFNDPKEPCPSYENLLSVAEYFNVPITYFEDDAAEIPTPDAGTILDQLIASLGADAQVNFSASEMSEDEKAFLLKSLQNSLEKFELYKKLKEDWQDENQ